MRLTISDIAKKAGVSKTTVSRVLNNRPDVDQNTRQNVLKIIEENNWVPNPIAVGYVNNKTHLIGLVIPASMHAWQLEVFQGVVAGFKDYNYQLLLLADYNNKAAEVGKEFDRTFNNGLADGLIVLHPSLVRNYMDRLSHTGLPVVMIDDTGFFSQLDLPSVGATNYIGGLQAIRYLISLGHRQIGYVGSSTGFRFSQDRLDGYKAALAEAGISFNQDLVSQVQTGPEVRFYLEENGYKGTQVLLERHDTKIPFTALFAETDEMAFGAMNALSGRGLRVPEDISVMGFDDLPRASYSVPPLTTIRQPNREMGKTAVRMLVDQIEGRPYNSRRIELPTELVIRGSTRAI